MSFPDLIIGGILVPREASLTVSQSFEEIGPRSLLRLGDGTGLPQSHGWTKLRTSISCMGWTSDGLAGIDWSAEAGITIACITPRSIKAASNVITIPAARRTDAAPWGFALVAGKLVATPVAVTGNLATLTVVTGAAGYKVEWLPLLTCFSEGGVRSNYDSQGNEYGWTLDAEQL